MLLLLFLCNVVWFCFLRKGKKKKTLPFSSGKSKGGLSELCYDRAIDLSVFVKEYGC